jgi:methionyl-tRNA formyltransferase
MPLNIVYMGTPAFAVPPLKRLLESHHRVRAVVTQPDRPAGRGKHLTAPPVKEFALAHHLPVLQPEKLRGQHYDSILAMHQPDVIVVVAYGRILPPEILSLPKHGCLNIHASLLPKWRGASPIQHAIMNGDKITGVTIMQLDEGMDTGPIVSQQDIEILEDDDYVSVSNMLSVIGGEQLIQALDDIEARGEVRSTPQLHELATHASLLRREDGLIDWTQGSEDLTFRMKGLQPWPGAFSFLQGAMWKFLRAQPVYEWDLDEAAEHLMKEADAAAPGTVTGLWKNKGFFVRTGDGHLLITAVQPPGKKPLNASDVVNGGQIEEGRLFLSDPGLIPARTE